MGGLAGREGDAARGEGAVDGARDALDVRGERLAEALEALGAARARGGRRRRAQDGRREPLEERLRAHALGERRETLQRRDHVVAHACPRRAKRVVDRKSVV